MFHNSDNYIKSNISLCNVALHLLSMNWNACPAEKNDKSTTGGKIKSTTPSPHRPAWEGTVDDKEELTASAISEGHMQKTTSVSSFPRSPSSVSRGYLSLATVQSPGRMSAEGSNQSPKNSGFLSSGRTSRKPLLVRSEVSIY